MPDSQARRFMPPPLRDAGITDRSSLRYDSTNAHLVSRGAPARRIESNEMPDRACRPDRRARRVGAARYPTERADLAAVDTARRGGRAAALDGAEAAGVLR